MPQINTHTDRHTHVLSLYISLLSLSLDIFVLSSLFRSLTFSFAPFSLSSIFLSPSLSFSPSPSHVPRLALVTMQQACTTLQIVTLLATLLHEAGATVLPDVALQSMWLVEKLA